MDFIVMEYISGKTVDALIPRQGMRLTEVLRICIAVADGLAKAHSAGIVHRDIKPSNLMVADDGRVKILDFGLAKLTESAESGEEDTTQTQRPTTGEGVVLGTVAYMSPEQVEGRKLDVRTDIFSFGAVLYEMLSGHKAFSGTSSVLTLSAILREDPPKPENLPPEVDRVLRRCLRKDPAKRFQHMDDLRVALEELRDESESGGLKISEQVAKPRRRTWAIPVIALVAIGAISTLLFAVRRNQKGTEPVPAGVRLRQITADTGLTASPDISRDGKLLVYASDRGTNGNLDLYVQPMTEGATPIRLTTNPADDWQPSLSSDGGQIAFASRREGNNIYVIPALGGEERLIVRGGTYPRFSPDGKWIAYCTTNNALADSELFVIPTTGGTPRRLAADVGWAGAPTWSADGNRLLFPGQDAPNTYASMQFWLASLDGSKSTRTNLREVVEQKSGRSANSFQLSGDTAIVVTSGPGGGSELWSVHLDGTTGMAREPQRLTTTTSGLFHIRGNMPRLVVAAGRLSFHLWKLPFDLDAGKATGALQLIPHSGGSQFMPASSLDGTVLAYAQDSPSARDMRVRFADGRESVLVIEQARPRVSPDGNKVAYSVMTESGSKGLFLMNAKGGQSTTLLDRTRAAAVYGWTADGRDLVFWNGSPIRFSLFNLETRQQSVLIAHPKHNIHGAELSPDRRWVAFHLVGAESSPVFIAPVRDGKAADEAEWSTIASYPGYNRRPWWSPNGNLLYFISERDGTSCVWAQRLEASSKRPQGDAFPVFHFHEARRIVSAASASFGPAVSRNALVFGLLERVSDIWIGEKE